MDLYNALWITLIGMGLVFVAILALWGLMVLLVRLTPEKEEAGEVEADAEAAAEIAVAEIAATEAGPSLDRKRRAAAAAVAVALAQKQSKPSRLARELQPAGTVSPWQAVHRASQMSQRVNAIRKKVVR